MDLNTVMDFQAPDRPSLDQVAAEMGKTPTGEQIAAVEGHFKPGHKVIRAYAGATKTTTLRFIAHADPSTPMVYVCFNKAIAEESRKVFPKNVECSTAHSLAYRAMLHRYDFNKTKKMTNSLRTRDVCDLLKVKGMPIFGGTAELDSSTIGYATLRTVVRFMQSADETVQRHHFERLPKFETLEREEYYAVRDVVVAYAVKLWDIMHDPKAKDVPLGHDGYLKAWQLSGPVINFPKILLDEGQDTNPVLLAILQAQVGAELTMVGDGHQAIYEWRGAIDAMNLLTGAAEFRLTKSFRFGENIAAAANQVLKALGETVPLVGNEARQDKLVAKGGKTTICRTNGEILSRLIDLMALGGTDRAFVQGGVSEMLSILDGADALKNKRKSWHQLFMGFNDWEEFEVYAEKSGDGEATKVVKLVSKYGIYALKNALRNVREVEDDAQVVLTTGHKSKGREWDTVELADDFKKQPEKDKEGNFQDNLAETRLFYVAMTRAKRELSLPFWAHERYGIPIPAGKEPPEERGE